MEMEVVSRTFRTGIENSLEYSLDACNEVKAAEPDIAHQHDARCYARVTDIEEHEVFYGVVQTANGPVTVTAEFPTAEEVPTPTDAEIAALLPPDLSGFYAAAMENMGAVKANQWMMDNPAIIKTLDAGNYTLARTALEQLVAAGKITPEDGTGLLALADAYGIK